MEIDHEHDRIAEKPQPRVLHCLFERCDEIRKVISMLTDALAPCLKDDSDSTDRNCNTTAPMHVTSRIAQDTMDISHQLERIARDIDAIRQRIAWPDKDHD